MSATRISDLIESLQKLAAIHGDALVTVTDPYDGRRYPALIEVETDEFDHFASIHVHPGVWADTEEGTAG